MSNPLQLSPHALRRYLATGKALHVEPMEPQPVVADDGQITHPEVRGPRKLPIWYTPEQYVAAGYAPHRVGDRVEVMVNPSCPQFACTSATVTDVKTKRISDMTIDEWKQAGREVKDWPPSDTSWAWLTRLEKA